MKKYGLVFLCFVAGSAQAQFVVNNGIAVVNSADVTVNGDWDNQSAAFLNNGIIAISGNWTSAGGYSVSGSGGFTLTNTATQQFSHSRQSVAILTKNGSGVTQINNPITILTQLHLQYGVLDMTTANQDTIIIKANAAVSGGASSYVNGKVTRYGTGNLYFPVSRAGKFLPMTIHGVSGGNPKVTISVEDAPGGYTIAGADNSSIGFPYAWRSNAMGVDTASFVDVEYPTTLPVSTTPIVIRSISAGQFGSMRLRDVSTAGGFTTIKSQDNGVKGLFTIAQGISDQAITFDAIASVTIGTSSFALTATADSGLGVVYTTESDHVVVTGSSVALVNPGRVSITASQPGDLFYHAATPVDQSFCVNPAQPTVSISGDNTESPTLTSTAASGNQWFLNDVAIAGATAATLVISSEGIYKVQATVDDCPSAFSEIYPIIVTGDITPTVAVDIYPNPTYNDIYITGMGVQPRDAAMVNMVGELSAIKLERRGDLLHGDIRHLPPGMYILKVAQGNDLRQLRFVKH